MSEWKKHCSHLELYQSQLCTTKTFCSLLFCVTTALTSLDCCQKVRGLTMKYFLSTMAEVCKATSPNHGCGKATLTTTLGWPGIPYQALALPLSHWNEQTSPCFCKTCQRIMHVLGCSHSSNHSHAKDGILVEKRTKSNTPPFNETQEFHCAYPQWGQSKLV